MESAVWEFLSKIKDPVTLALIVYISHRSLSGKILDHATALAEFRTAVEKRFERLEKPYFNGD